MKIATVFFKSKTSSVLDAVRYVLKHITYVVYGAILLSLLTFFVSKIGIGSMLITYATDIHLTSEIGVNFATIKNINPIFNASSYLVDSSGKTPQSDVVLVSNENKTQLELLDAISKSTAVEVFVSKKELQISVNDTGDAERVTVNNMKILNYSSLRGLNFQEVYNKVITLTKSSDKILLYNTHTSESYTNSDKYKFEYTGNMRTTNAEFNMISVAKEFAKNLKDKNIQIVQDTTPHDYGTYTSAYSRSKVTVQNAVKTHGNFGIAIDVHRDAITDTTFAPKVMINGVSVAQCMFVIGVGTAKNRNPYAQDNLSLAMQLQLLADEIYPGLFRPMIVRDSMYNQDLNKYAMIIEVGATGNTLEESYYATRCLSNLLDIIYKN